MPRRRESPRRPNVAKFSTARPDGGRPGDRSTENAVLFAWTGPDAPRAARDAVRLATRRGGAAGAPFDGGTQLRGAVRCGAGNVVAALRAFDAAAR